ncbi:MAG: hypothetical protein HY809_05400 [Nitrospirae bacterium]|nr:hypothetical protein [Nitrospirota bacterium]
MKTGLTTRLLLMLLIGVFAVMAPQWAGASTAPCTTITNKATLNYSVGGVGQPAIDSNETTFNVGVKVIVVVTNNDGAHVTVVPGTTKTALKFTVVNNGNAVQDYDLTYTAQVGGAAPYGGTDTFNGTTIAIYDDTGGTVGSFDGTDADITATPVLNNVPADGGSRVVYIVYTPSDLAEANGAIAAYILTATSKWADDTAITYASGTAPTFAQAGGSCNGAKTISVVAGDGDGPGGEGDKDGAHSDDGAYEVSSAIIDVTKSQSVIWDPINYNSTPKYLPSAIVEYSIAIANTGGAVATLTTITDALQTANLTLVTAFKDGGLGTATPTSSTGKAFVVTCSAACGTRACESAGYAFTSASDADGIEYASPTITATMATVLPSEDSGACPVGQLDATTGLVTIKFQATIN